MTVHFIAIGGSVMHQLAIALKKKGYKVTGSDDEIFEPARGNLEQEGLLPAFIGWYPEKINAGLDAVILGMHARGDNPELLRAQELNLKIYSFPAYIYEESRQKTRVVVGGSHGKTTTTSMIMHVLQKLGKQFDYLVGAKVEGFSQSVNITDAPLIVCEGDEYPASTLERRPKFHFFFPHVAILTGIAWDHINVFPTFELYLAQFATFIRKIEKGGILIYNETDPQLRELVKEMDIARSTGYGIPEHWVEEGTTWVRLEGVTGKLKIFGNHNLLNMHAAFLACAELGIAAADFVKAMESFKGASKRLELLAEGNTFRMYRDFAHAPSKVKATIEAVKQQFPSRKLIALIELHTYSSLNAEFLEQYRGVADAADQAAVYYSDHALAIKKMPPIAKEQVAHGFAKEGLKVINNRQELEEWLEQQDYSNSNLLLMSSGNFEGLDLTTFAGKIASNLGD
ncbi:MAG: peptidoglycan synthetase [Williamsia sp.]|nr:peptidoglycan synthetase [Williamsia sp.]